MLFKGLHHKILHFNLEYWDDAELTGFNWQSEITRLSLHLSYWNHSFGTSILVSEVWQIIKWFENLSKNTAITPKLLVLDKQLCFELLENHQNVKTVRITYDTTVPVPGIGGYSLSPGAKKEDFLDKVTIECEMDDIQLQRIIKKLTAELEIELQIGLEVESKKPKKDM